MKKRLYNKYSAWNENAKALDFATKRFMDEIIYYCLLNNLDLRDCKGVMHDIVDGQFAETILREAVRQKKGEKK